MYKERVKYRYQRGGSIGSVLGNALSKTASVASKLTPALTKGAELAGKVVSNKAVQQIANTGLNIGASVAANKIAEKIAGTPVMDYYTAVSSKLPTKDEMRKKYIDGQITIEDYKNFLRELNTYNDSQISGGYKNIMNERKKIMKKQQKNITNKKQNGGFAPLAAAAAVGLPMLGAIGAGLLEPIFNQISSKFIRI